MGHAAAPTDNVNVEFARAIINFGSRSSLNCAKLGLDDTNLGLVDDFLNIDDLEEFPDEDLAAPISNNNKNNDDNYNTYDSYNTTCTSLTSSKSSSALCEDPSHMKPLGVLSSDSLQDIIGPLCNELEPELEWLSSFNCEDSGEDLELQKKESKAMVRGFTSIPGRARSKRSGRTKARVWGYGRKAAITKEGLTTSSTITCEKLTESDASSGSTPVLMQAECDDENPGKVQVWKKMKKGGDEEVVGGGQAAAAAAAGGGRRCEHCWAQKTPQWREGPGGPKTLCNACGVRYKSGRLFPEYRPAKSPTFLTSMHSNSHKKVLEMRRQHLLLPNHFPPHTHTRITPF